MVDVALVHPHISTQAQVVPILLPMLGQPSLVGTSVADHIGSSGSQPVGLPCSSAHQCVAYSLGVWSFRSQQLVRRRLARYLGGQAKTLEAGLTSTRWALQLCVPQLHQVLMSQPKSLAHQALATYD